MLFVQISPHTTPLRIVSVTYHLASSSVLTMGWYFVFVLGGRSGIAILAKCKFNDLEARIMGGKVYSFFPWGCRGNRKDVKFEFG